MTRIFLTLTLAGTAMAQVGAPTIGLLPDSGTVRMMSGIPASGSIGPLLGNGQTFSQVVASSTGSFAVASAADGTVVVLTVASDGVSVQTSVVAGAAAGSVQLSPNSSAVVIANGGQLQVITGLPGSPMAQPPVDASFLGAATVLAVSDDGKWVAGVFGGSVYALGSGGQVITLPAPAGVTALAFYHGTSDLAVTSGTQIVKLSGIEGTPTSTSLFGSADAPAPPESPIALALTADNARVVLMEPSGGIGEIELSSGVVTTANCGCAPEGLAGLGGSVFRLSSLNGGSVKIYDAASGSVWFVPLAPVSTQGGQQ